MVLAAKIFEVKTPTSLEEIADKLRDFRRVENEKVDDHEFELITGVDDLDTKRNILTCIFYRDKIIFINQRGKVVPTLKTASARIYFHDVGGRIFLTVLQKKHFANAVASILSHHLFLTYRGVVEAQIPADNLRAFHERNPEATKVIYFDNLDFPGVDKVALYGDSLKTTGKYEEYLMHGKIWYLVFTVQGSSAVLGLTRNCVVTSFSRISEDKFMDYVVEHVFPLIK
ncbi:MAG: hypothetical protein NXY59_05950 [Aigarchaeota archaeon]|nr:hypothetical protein [Candidatus Pelearchaeum maunauluense]